jgi:hypothetical protein
MKTIAACNQDLGLQYIYWRCPARLWMTMHSTRTYIKLSGQCQSRDGYFVFARDNQSMKTCFCAPFPPECSRVFSILFQPSERG